MDLLVREAREQDAEGIIGVLNPIIAAGCYTALDRMFSVDEECSFIREFPQCGIFHVAVQTDGTVVGFQNVEPFATYTRAFDHVGVIGTYVDLTRRGQGIAALLFAEMFRVAGTKGFEKLFAFVRADNEAALATYKRHGFEVIGTARRHAKLQGRYVDEVMIERFLPSEAGPFPE
jgi:L-amino acid N-acyltransferase YncA